MMPASGVDDKTVRVPRSGSCHCHPDPCRADPFVHASSPYPQSLSGPKKKDNQGEAEQRHAPQIRGKLCLGPCILRAVSLSERRVESIGPASDAHVIAPAQLTV